MTEPETDTDRLADVETAQDRYSALDRHLGEIIGHKLFTLMVIDRQSNEAARVYSSNPVAYPVKGRKPLGDMGAWGDRVLEQGKPFIGYDAEDLRSVFFDHALIARLGCSSVLNVPVVSDGTVIGTINLLHEAGWYHPAHAERADPFARALVAPFDAWAAARGTP